MFVRLMMDLFAMAMNKKLSFYCSAALDSMAWKQDAPQHPWDHLQVCTFPTFALLKRVLKQ